MKKATITISTTATNQLSVDFVTIHLTLKSLKMKYGEAYSQVNQQLSTLRNHFQEDITTDSYNVFPRFNYQEEKRTFEGYEVAHQVSIGITLKSLDKALETLSTLSFSPEFHLEFKSQKEKEARDQLLVEAYQKALHQAQIIAGAANQKILGIHEVLYQSDKAPHQPIARFAASDQIAPTGISLHETVTCTFLIGE